MTSKSDFLKKIFKRAVNKFLAGKASKAELIIIERYYAYFNDYENCLKTYEEAEVDNIGRRLLSEVYAKIEKASKGKGFFRGSMFFQIAAIMLTIISLSLYVYHKSGSSIRNNIAVNNISDKIEPGSNKATLTLSDGSSIVLNKSSKALLAKHNITQVNKATESVLIYANELIRKDKLEYNKITTPRGGQYCVTLSDGTKVWLNAASSLHYPLAFNSGERKVELSGEAYFEVAKDKTRPFKVVTALQQVTVLGTHFNINAYGDEKITRTTLLEGSVKVNQLNTKHSSLLIPGQQSAVADDIHRSIQIKSLDTDEAVAWKMGYFMFDNESLESVLRKVSRWYDVEIDYQGKAQGEQLFSGTLSKYSQLSKLLEKLELTSSVHFEIKGRRIMVK